MTIPLSYMGAVIGLLVGVLLKGSLFGQTSSAGYHNPNGQFTSKGGAILDKAVLICVTSVAGYYYGPYLLEVAITNPALGVVVVLSILYISLHREIEVWNTI